MKRILMGLLCLGAACAMSAGSAEAAQYKVIDLGNLPGYTHFSEARGINNNGEVVGWALPDDNSSNMHGFVWKNGTMQSLGDYTEAYGINDKGDIVGDHNDNEVAFIIRNGQIQNLAPPTGKYSFAYSINESGDIAGYSMFPYAFCLWKSSTPEILGNGHANCINEQGQMAGDIYNESFGFHAALWSNNQLTDLGTLSGSGWSQAFAINDIGHVVGGADTKGGVQHAFLWKDNKMQDIGTLGGLSSTAYGINKNDCIVGMADTSDGCTRAFLRQNGVIQDLGAIYGGSYSIAFAINDNGWVAGLACDATGKTHAVIWTPVPEHPPSYHFS